MRRRVLDGAIITVRTGTLARSRNEIGEGKRMSSEKQAAVYAPPGEGEALWLLGDTYTLTISGEQTGGAFTLLEAVVPPGGGPPPHIHHLEDEVFVILEGELAVTVAGRALPAPVVTVISVPKGTQHSYAVVGTAPVRMLFLYACLQAWRGCLKRSESWHSRASQPHRSARRMSPNSALSRRSTTLRLCRQKEDDLLLSPNVGEGR
jgi:mannose-6-phosphate isomerase-like protein (cupin superfamily)